MGLGTTKLHFATSADAERILTRSYGPVGWSNCPDCGGSVPTRPAAQAADSGTARSPSTSTADIDASPAIAPVRAADAPTHVIRDMLDDVPGVYVWTPTYIKYPPRSAALDRAAEELRVRLSALVPAADQILHAVYNGPKGTTTDVENNLFYNIHDGRDTLRGAAKGVRFEWNPGPAPSLLGSFGAHYAYSFTASGAPFRHWTPSRTLASWPAVDLGPLRGEKKLEQVWFALRTSPSVTVEPPARHGRAWFGLRLHLSMPRKHEATSATFLKSVLDGVVSAFHVEPSHEQAAQVASRVTEILDSAGRHITQLEVVRLLTDDAIGILGPRPGLRNAAQWCPYDEDCVAVEVLFSRESGPDHSLSGEVFVASERPDGD